MSTAHSFGEAAVLDTLSVNLQSIHLTEEQFYRLCEDNPELRLELTARGELRTVPNGLPMHPGFRRHAGTR